MKSEHAVVVGASMAGLIAARVLADRFERVTVIDRDTLPTGDENRAGVPQGRHGHGLLASGFRALEGLFPGLQQELVAAGAVPGDIIGNVRWFQHGHYKARFPSGLGGLLLSRPLLEGTLRRRVRRLQTVSIVEGTPVSGLMSDSSRQRVTGVRLDRPGQETSIEADLVIDASGRASRSPEWLPALGYEAPALERVEVDLCYTTRTFRRRPGDLQGDKAVILAPMPPRETRVGFMLAMEGDRWIVTIGGFGGDQAPTNPQGFLAFSRTLSRPDIYEVIRDAEPLTDALPFRFRASVRRRYENLARFPGQYLVIGDAICSFNPFYGQGMSAAALEGLALRDCLTERPDDSPLWSLFFGAAARVVDMPWTIASGSDFAFDAVRGVKPPGTDLVNWYLARVHRAGASDPVVCRAFFEVANLLAPASSLFHPSVVMRVASASMRRSESPSEVARRWMESERPSVGRPAVR